MTTGFIEMPDQALAEGFAHHVVRWARESNAPDHTLDALRAAARATSLATASGHACTSLGDIVACGDDLDEQALRRGAARVRNGRHAGDARCAPVDPRRRRPRLPASLLRLRTPSGATPDRSLRRHAPGAIGEEAKALLDSLFAANAKRLGDRPDWQKIATALALERRLTIISGGPGTGKTTTVVNVLACVLVGQSRIAGSAWPPRPARRPPGCWKRSARPPPTCPPTCAIVCLRSRSRSTACWACCPAPASSATTPATRSPIDLLVVDEASMLDLALATKLVEAVPPSAHIILLGDKDQLAAVESGAVFSELSADPTLSKRCIQRLSGGHRHPRPHTSGVQRRASRPTCTTAWSG